MGVSQAQKLRGGYYTPSVLAAWMTNWAIQRSSDTVLEPSCGNGVFVCLAAEALLARGASKRQAAQQLTSIELHSEEARKAAVLATDSLQNEKASITCGDFFEWSKKHAEKQFDCVIGNPPFIRYQSFPEPSRSIAMAMMQSSGLTPNRLTNIWVPFVVAAVNHLSPGGRLAMVLPAELLQVTYAAQLRAFLLDRFETIEVVSCNDMVFKHAEQEIVILLGAGRLANPPKDSCCSISLFEAQGFAALVKHKPMRVKQPTKYLKHTSEKWLKYFLSAKEIHFMRALRQNAALTNLSLHAEVDVGVVTGRNDFFVVSKDEIAKFDLKPYSVPLVGRSAHLKGAIIDKGELNQFAKNGDRVYLLAIDRNTNGSLPAGIRRYIRLGEESGIHTGYKCAVRTPWYSVPSVWKPDYFFFRQIYDFPRVVLNRANATSTDTIHRMRCRNGHGDRLAANLYTYLTAASAEIEGRSYGGGVLELEPTEAERLLVPKHLSAGLGITELDVLIRQKRLEDALDENSRAVLTNAGLAERECGMLRRIWHKMRDRRMNRKMKQVQCGGSPA